MDCLVIIGSQDGSFPWFHRSFWSCSSSQDEVVFLLFTMESSPSSLVSLSGDASPPHLFSLAPEEPGIQYGG